MTDMLMVDCNVAHSNAAQTETVIIILENKWGYIDKG